MKITLIKAIPTLVVLAMLTGCAGMSGQFGCHATAGSSCTPVSQVNAKATAGDFDYQTSGAGQIRLPTRQTVLSSMPSSGYHGITPMPGQPVRSEGRIQRIWIAPYQDQGNNYHEPSYVYTVLEKPHWIGVPAHAIKTTETEEDD